MKLKNTKYILLLLAGIIGIATGCGCGKGDGKGGAGCGCGKGDGKGGAGADVTELEATEKKLLDELKPLFVAWKKTQKNTVTKALFTDKEVEEVFKREYSDPTYLLNVQDMGVVLKPSYAYEWNNVKKFYDKDPSVLRQALNRTEMELGKTKRALARTSADKSDDKVKAFWEKEQEFLENRKKMLETFGGIEADSNDNK
jgi:hypothetical protein